MHYPNGQQIMHAELKIRSTVLMLADENPQWGTASPLGLSGQSPVSIMLYVPDVDATFAQATALGAKPILPPMDAFWGDRYGKFADPFGHLWSIATQRRDLSPEGIQQGAEAWCSQQT
jgi:uncharacterized glyoxalase superfamily protein PhnB